MFRQPILSDYYVPTEFLCYFNGYFSNHIISLIIFQATIGCAANSLDLICYIFHSIEAPLKYSTITLLYCCVKLIFIYLFIHLYQNLEKLFNCNDLTPIKYSESNLKFTPQNVSYLYNAAELDVLHNVEKFSV